MMCGRRAFHRETAAETMTAILREDPPELEASVEGLPAALGRVVQHCLEKAPDDRYRTASEVLAALDTRLADEPDGPDVVLLVPPRGADDLPRLSRIETRVVGSLGGQAWEHVELPEAAGDGALHPLFRGGQQLVHSITTLATPHDGSSLATLLYFLVRSGLLGGSRD